MTTHMTKHNEGIVHNNNIRNQQSTFDEISSISGIYNQNILKDSTKLQYK